uniref:Neurochondrin-like protein n=1 Tax=Syphacia muris TaxID=451379 RepID=A0A0N5A7Y4_9BILA
MSIRNVPSDGEKLSQLLKKFESMKNIDGSLFCRLLKTSPSDQDVFILLACLPKLMEQSMLEADDLTTIASLLPINFLQRILSNSGDQDSESYQRLIINILSVVLSNCGPEYAVNFMELQRPLYELLKKSIAEFESLIDLMNAICGYLNANEKKLPSLTLLKYVTELLERFTHLDTTDKEFLQESWPTDLRAVLTKIFRSRGIAQDYQRICFGIATLAIELLSIEWFNREKQFALVLVALAEVELQLILDNPEKASVDEVISCASIVSKFIQLTSNEEFLDDESATQVSISCQRAVTYACHCLLEYEKDDSIKIDKNIKIVLLRLICSFFAVDGAAILDKELVINTIPVLIKIAKENIAFGDGCLCESLFKSLASTRNLPNCVLGFALDYLEVYTSDGAVALVRDFIHAARCGGNSWYTESDILRAKNISSIASEPELREWLDNN